MFEQIDKNFLQFCRQKFSSLDLCSKWQGQQYDNTYLINPLVIITLEYLAFKNIF